MRDCISTLPDTETQVQNNLLEPVECLGGLCDVVQDVGIELMELGKVPEVEEGANTDDKLWVSAICDQSKDIPLDVLMLAAGYLLQQRDARREVAVTTLRLEKRKGKVQLGVANSPEDPLHIVVPE